MLINYTLNRDHKQNAQNLINCIRFQYTTRSILLLYHILHFDRIVLRYFMDIQTRIIITVERIIKIIDNEYENIVMDSSMQLTNGSLSSYFASAPKTYEQLLDLSAVSTASLQKLSMQETHTIWRSLYKLELSTRMNEHSQAISELKLTKSQILSFMRSSQSQQSNQMYRKVFVAVGSTLTNRLLVYKKYSDAQDCCEQIVSILHSKSAIRQAIFSMFGFESLVALENYNLQSNLQFKYPADAQIMFFYAVGKVKIIADRPQQARYAFQKILSLQKVSYPGFYILLRVYSYLCDLAPQQYTKEHHSLQKTSPSDSHFSAEQKNVTNAIVKMLLQREHQLTKHSSLIDQLEVQYPNKINKKLMLLYFEYLLRKNNSKGQLLAQTYVQQVRQTINKENNVIVINQMIEDSKLSKQALQFYQNFVNRIQQATMKHYLRKMLIIDPNRKPVLQTSTVVKTKIQQQPNKLKMGSKRIRSLSPPDKQRANQILKRCMMGCNVRKINFGNTSYSNKFARVQDKGLVWGDNQKDIEFTSSICKWKHVLGITYGKVSQNLTKAKFAFLEPWRCFSLITHDRSYDFYCQNQSQIFFWLQGISYKLQLFHNKKQCYPFYSKGRALWKMNILRMGSKIAADPTKKYKMETAGNVLRYRKSLKNH